MVYATYLQHINNNMSIIDTLIGIIAPHDCLGCGREGNLVCADCSAKLIAVPERCHRCYQLSAGAQTCVICSQSSSLHRVSVGTLYQGIAKDLVWKLKFAGAQSATTQMIKRLVPLMDGRCEPFIVPVPTATSRVRQRGYDQAKLLARELAKQARLPYMDCLARSGQAHQVGAMRSERLHQLATAFHVNNSKLTLGAHILLVDDVLTTGATLEAAAKALKIAGASRIDAAVFAQTEA